MKRKSLIFPFSLCLFIVTAGTGYASGTDIGLLKQVKFNRITALCRRVRMVQKTWK